MRDLQIDLRYAVRSLLRSPATTLVAVFAIAVGIGANTVVYSIVHGILVDPFPAADLDDVVFVQARQADSTRRFGDANFVDLQRRFATDGPFSELVAARTTGLRITDSDRPLMPAMRRVSADYFRALGVTPVLGRTFTEAEDQPGRDRVAVLTHEFWSSYYGGDRDVVGRSIELLGEPYEIVGVLPAGHRDPIAASDAVLYLPMAFDPAMVGHEEPTTGAFLMVFGRVAPGVSEAQLEASLASAAEDLGALYPDANPDLGFSAVDVREAVTGDVAPSLWLLLAAVICVLLIACGNVANLLLARSVARRREITIRRALGAGSRHLLRQLTVEGLVLASAGAVCGLGLAYLALGSVVHWIPPNFSGLALTELRIDGNVLWFTLLLTTSVGLVFGLVPAVHALRGESEVASAGASRAVGSRSAGVGRGLLVAGEVALSLALLIAATLTVQSVLRLSRLSVGLDPENVQVFRTSARGDFGVDGESRIRFHARVLENLRSTPGVEKVAAVHFTPVQFPWQGRDVEIPDQDYDSETPPQALTKAVSPGFFDTLAIPVLSGRDFGPSDRLESEPVAIVNRAMAERYWPAGDALDARLSVAFLGGDSRRIVGIVGDLRDVGEDPEPKPQVYVPNLQFSPVSQNYVVKTRLGQDDVADAIRQAVWAIDPDSPVYGEQSMVRVVDDRDWRSRFVMRLLTGFGLLALVLAGSGIYGVLSFLVSSQRKEMGVRMAIGARRIQVLALVLGRALRPTALGIALGLGAGLAFSRALQQRLYGVEAFDPLTFGAVSLVLLAVAVGASLLPALRATRVDPATVLHED